MTGITWVLTLLVCAGIDGDCLEVDMAPERTHAACTARMEPHVSAWLDRNPTMLLVSAECQERVAI
jgi:hypothetical protein